MTALFPLTRALCTLQLEGSSLVESINNKFTATMTNSVRWREADGGGGGDTGFALPAMDCLYGQASIVT